MLCCNACEKYYPLGDGMDHGVCSLPEVYFAVDGTSPCVFLLMHKKTCASCSHFENDTACYTARATDDICVGFEDKREVELTTILFEWLKQGTYSRERLLKLCDAFEQTDVYQFVSAHLSDVILNEDISDASGVS